MSAATRAVINRQNATHSTGPRTEEGRNRSKLNALRHGLASSRVLLPHEDAEVYQAARQGFIEHHQPASDLERELLARMVDCWWRLQRAYRVEAEFLAQRGNAIAKESDHLEGDAALALLFSDPKEMAQMRLFMRYLAGAERAWNRAAADFAKAKKERLQQECETAVMDLFEDEEADEPARHEAQTLAAPESIPSAGFVSQPVATIPAPKPENLALRL